MWMQRAFVVVAAGRGLALSAGCGTSMFGGGSKTTYPMTSGSTVPAAMGMVTVKSESNGNREVEIAVEHLAAPGRAFSGMSTYVVWLVPASGGGPQNMGVLATGDDLKGKLRIQTPYNTFDIVVSAEAAPNVSNPSDNQVLTARVQFPA
jgi:hypothetical protein